MARPSQLRTRAAAHVTPSADAGMLAGDPLDRVVGGSVVDDDDLEAVRWVVAGGQRRQARAEVILPVPADDDHRRAWQFLHRRSSVAPGLRPGLSPGFS